MNLGLASSQRPLLGHDGLLQGLQRALDLLDLDHGLRLLLLQLPLGSLHLGDPLAEGRVCHLCAGFQVTSYLGQDAIHDRPEQ